MLSVQLKLFDSAVLQPSFLRAWEVQATSEETVSLQMGVSVDCEGHPSRLIFLIRSLLILKFLFVLVGFLSL